MPSGSKLFFSCFCLAYSVHLFQPVSFLILCISLRVPLTWPLLCNLIHTGLLLKIVVSLWHCSHLSSNLSFRAFLLPYLPSLSVPWCCPVLSGVWASENRQVPTTQKEKKKKTWRRNRTLKTKILPEQPMCFLLIASGIVICSLLSY